ncbi:MAG: transporter associated domain-containing protein, partial [Thermomicrobiales bacterium]
LEEIVGEIQDEYDSETPLFELAGHEDLIADGRLALEDVEDTLRVRFEKDDYGTLGGFVQRHMGRVPEEGDAFEAEGVRVEILEVERHRVRKLRVVKAPTVDEITGEEPLAQDDSGQNSVTSART